MNNQNIMNNLLDMLELVGGPLCGAVIAIDDTDKDTHEVPYYAGIALYRVRVEGGKADYIGEA